MKKENVTENNELQVVMDESTLKAVVEDNISIVPKNKMKEFMSMPLKKQAQKIKLYQDIAKMKADAKEKNRIVNRVKEMFEKRHGSVEDARDVMKFCTEFIDNFKQRQIEDIDKKIAELEEMKMHL